MKYALIFLITGLLSGCGTKKSQNSAYMVSDTAELTESPEFYDTLYVEGDFVIFLWPDSFDQNIMKSTYDETSYNKFVDDMTWYTGLAAGMLDSFDISNKITDRDVIVYNNAKGNYKYSRKSVKGDMIFFSLDKEPFITSTTDFKRTDALEYYHRK